VLVRPVLLIYPAVPRLLTTAFNVRVLTYPAVPKPFTVLLNEIGVFKELIYPAVPRPATVLIKLRLLTYPRVPKAVTVLMVENACTAENEDNEDVLINPNVEREAAIVLTVLGSLCKLLSLASRVAALI